MYLVQHENTEVPERLRQYLSPTSILLLRFGPAHVRTTILDTELAEEVKLFFDNERLFFWIECHLPLIAQWLKVSTSLLNVRDRAYA